MLVIELFDKISFLSKVLVVEIGRKTRRIEHFENNFMFGLINRISNVDISQRFPAKLGREMVFIKRCMHTIILSTFPRILQECMRKYCLKKFSSIVLRYSKTPVGVSRYFLHTFLASRKTNKV